MIISKVTSAPHFVTSLASTLFVALLGCQSVWAECEAEVDLADSLEFQRFHSKCDETSPTATSGDNKQSAAQHAVADGSGPDGEKSTAAQTAASEPTATQVKDATNGESLEIAEPFTLTGGQQSAYQGLLQQMAARCPQGWVKEKEWVTPATVGYLLHHRFRCL